ncbi:TetR/AcrR family transcriptional regulator [Prescottella equi]|uniref:TetR family transcriptional regulator n=1 Tax=Rhodococcus hoagii TaxID=43767 RepID=A0A9Q2S9G9_RHOHA|nr:TetR/AcrR family transcriptional regulator [Prescottella equi]MBM4480831.1 TetR family transcriptional regulator [Prescottella equi]MBM4490748.1 TetR family transcriptional regulator [Prescottella equi]MBM4495329.1 TetR family transcriptional regulator [Prescottella equi]MBM4501702.1 TetR family transcriptional regulator [Prescottella equi]MBM4503147.1 TetR family transcriptional regulator [Prescottella equi]
MSIETAPPRRRLPPEERKRQLVAIGLQELSTRPIHALSIDQVAEKAGISRGLLFRYFPTKQDYYVAVVGAAARRLLRAAAPDAAAPTDDQLRAVVHAFVSFIDRHGDNYQSFFHGGFGADPQIQEIRENMKNTMVERTLAATGTEPTPAVRMLLRAWWSMVESLAIDRTTDPVFTVDDVVEHALAALPVAADAASGPDVCS